MSLLPKTDMAGSISGSLAVDDEIELVSKMIFG
jgi:hypothetical protein